MKKIALLVIAIICITFTFKTTNAAFPVAKKEVPTVQSEKSGMTSNSNAELTAADEEFTAASAPAAAGGGKSQLVALLLCIFVGNLGIHRFYLGYVWQGIVQLLTLGACGIWSLIDLIRIITGSLVPKDGSYAKTL